MKNYNFFEEWKENQSKKNIRLISRVEQIVKKSSIEFNKSVKWGQGCWLLRNKPIFYVHAEPDHIQLGFYNGNNLKDPAKLLAGKGKFVRFVVISNAKKIDSDAIIKLIKQASRK